MSLVQTLECTYKIACGAHGGVPSLCHYPSLTCKSRRGRDPGQEPHVWMWSRRPSTRQERPIPAKHSLCMGSPPSSPHPRTGRGQGAQHACWFAGLPRSASQTPQRWHAAAGSPGGDRAAGCAGQSHRRPGQSWRCPQGAWARVWAPSVGKWRHSKTSYSPMWLGLCEVSLDYLSPLPGGPASGRWWQVLSSTLCFSACRGTKKRAAHLQFSRWTLLKSKQSKLRLWAIAVLQVSGPDYIHIENKQAGGPPTAHSILCCSHFPIRGWQGELHSHTSPSTHTSMFYKQRLRKLLIKKSHLLQRSQYAAPWLLLKEATISNNFSQRKEKIPERLLHQSPKFLIQMFASEDACENLFGIPYFSDYKYLNSLGSFQDVRMEQRMN